MGKNFFSRKGSKRSMDLSPMDVAIIFKEDGHVDLSFPEVEGEQVPQHIFAALAVSNAIMDDDFFEEIQDAFEEKMAQEVGGDDGPDNNNPNKPDLKVVT